jgi:monovalent cation:proton antiporter-2 (CPA2) family protein
MSSIYLQGVIFLAAAVIVIPIAKRLGLGSVLGYLGAGILIGPFVFGWVGTGQSDIMDVAGIGIVMMLFLIGLSLKPSLVWQMRRAIVGLGGLQVLLSMVIIAGIAIAFGLHPLTGLALGLIMAQSSTVIALSTLQERGWVTTTAGQNVFSVSLFQDLAVIPTLAILPLLAVGGAAPTSQAPTLMSDLPAWIQSISVLGAIVLVILIGRYLVRPVFREIAATRLREVFVATALLLIFGVAVIMEMVGLSPALGAFMAGVMLANSEYRHELESDIDPFKGLLLGLFFMAVGASLDFNIIAAQPGMIFGLVALLMVAKGIVLLALGRLFGVKADQNILFSVLICQTGEFAFVLLAFASSNGILTAELADLMLVIVAVSMVLTPILIIVVERLILPHVGTKTAPERDADVIEERNDVIIAGFDRFGNVVGRLLKAHGVSTTVLDNDSDRVEALRRLGLKVYYGDATRHDLLKSAGADQARILVAALEDPERNIALVKTVKKHFPHLKILSRASDRSDAYALIDEGVSNVYRETVDTALKVGVDALVELGHRAYAAERMARKFRRHDERSMLELATLRDDRNAYFSLARQRIAELESLILSDTTDPELHRDIGWDAESLRDEAASRNVAKS